MIRLIVAAICLTATVIAADEVVKNKTAGGYGSYDGGYGGSGGYGGPVYYPIPHVQDRNVCDMDASVLLVVDNGRHGHNRAYRVRCSEIANYDEDSCNVCCQNAARRDTTLQNSEMFGFLALTNEKSHSDRKDDDDDDEDDETRRVKRGSDHHHKVDWTTVNNEKWEPSPVYKNVKCVCCAPKRQLPSFSYPTQPVYGQPQPAYGAAPAATGYGQAPAQAQPVYSAPVATQPYQPAAAPSGYAAPAAQQPTYTQPAAQAPAQQPTPY